MGQVISSKVESDGLYTITVKQPPTLSRGENQTVIKNLYRYEIPKNIVEKIQTMTFDSSVDTTKDREATNLEVLRMLISMNPVENVPKSDNYNSSLPSYVYFSFTEKSKQSSLFSLYAVEQNIGIDFSSKDKMQIPDNYKFNIKPCNSVVKQYCKTKSLGDFFKLVQSFVGIGSYISALVCTTILLCTSSAMLSVSFSSKGFNALTIILILCILSGLSTSITNIYNIYKLQNELSE